MRHALLRIAPALAVAVLLAACERPPVESVQTGFRGTGMDHVFNPRLLAEHAAANTAPAALPAVQADATKAGQAFQNVKVLGDLSSAEFTRLMVAITNWVSPKEGCNYCHTANLAEDTKYTKVVARRMLEMTQHINSKWKAHVGDTGVTCFTCHRGNPQPAQTWFSEPPHRQVARGAGGDAGQNKAATTVALASLPYDPFTPYLGGKGEIRVVSGTALPSGQAGTMQATEGTYGLMMHISQALGVNCTFCHNTRSFAAWDASTPQRTTAWHGIRMARDLNSAFLTPLKSVLPADHLGPGGDAAKVNCATCHQGVYKPLYGANMLKAHPELAGAGAKVSAAPAAAPATATTADGAIFYFPVGSAALAGDAATGVAVLVEALKAKAGSKVTVSGYHSAAGTQAQNEELAKQRAFAVRDALKAAGVADDRVVLDKPQQTEANVAGEDPKARRVEVAVR